MIHLNTLETGVFFFFQEVLFGYQGKHLCVAYRDVLTSCRAHFQQNLNKMG